MTLDARPRQAGRFFMGAGPLKMLPKSQEFAMPIISPRVLLKRLFAVPPGVDVRFHQTLILIGSYAVLFHTLFFCLFVLLHVMPMAAFNILSVGMWIWALFLTKTGHGMSACMLGITEVAVHQTLAVHFVGWESGFQQYLIPATILAFLIPGRWRWSAAIAANTIALYVALYYYSEWNVGQLSESLRNPLNLLYALNTISALFICAVGAAYYMRSLERAETALEVEHAKSESLLRNILPEEVAASLKDHRQVIADLFEGASVLFADVVNFTPLSAGMKPTQVVALLNEVFSGFDTLVEKYQLEKIKTIGDCYMVAAGVPRPRRDHACVLTQLALDMQDYVAQHQFQGKALNFRIGLNSGPLVAGVIGRKKFIYDLWGDTVNTASRMESHGKANCIQISCATYELVRDRFVCEPRGTIDVKGKGQMEIWHVLDIKA
jgi:adenylate cyclase